MINISKDELSRLHREDFIWLIWLIIIGFNIYSNFLEETYLKNKNINIRKKFRKINEGIFIVIVIIYLYFLIVSIDRIKELDSNASLRRKKATYLSLIVSLLFLVGGIISLYLTFESENLDDEIGII